MEIERTGILCVVSGPTASGKTTICRATASNDPGIYYTVSCTTRPPREGEEDGRDYYFLSEEAFRAKIDAGKFLEYATVHGRFYGTLKSEVLDHLAAGRDVIMDLDVQGAALLRECEDPVIQGALADVFILLTLEEIHERLSGRGTESEAQIEHRLANARVELTHWQRYGYTIPSGSKEEDLETFRQILEAERHRAARLTVEEDWVKGDS